MPAKKRKIVEARPVKSLRGLEAQYRVQMMKLARAVAKAVKTDLLSMLKRSQLQYVSETNLTEKQRKVKAFREGRAFMPSEVESRADFLKDGIALNLQAIFLGLNHNFSGVATLSFARQAATQAVTKTEKANKRRFDKSIKAATGVDLGAVLSAEGLGEFTQLNVSNNVSLIKSLPEEYLKSVETIVTNGVSSGARYSTIEKQINAKLGSANSKLVNRVKTIARNEIQTINSQISLRRSEKLGIKKGIYRTSEDERVRKCHAELNGDEYELAKGAWSKTCKKFIQPGITDINCRCTFSPVIVIEEGEKEEAVKPKPVKKPKITPIKKPEIKPKPPVRPKLKKVTTAQEVEKFQDIHNKSHEQIEDFFGIKEEEKTKMPSSIRAYVKGGSDDMNSALRAAGKTGKTEKLKEFEDDIRELDEILTEKNIKTPVQLNRGLAFREKKDFDEFLESVAVGTVHADGAYTSTTVGEIQGDFTGLILGEDIIDYGVNIKILADKNTRGAYLNQYIRAGTFREEKEFLLPRDTNFKILSRQKKGANAEITMEIINEPAPAKKVAGPSKPAVQKSIPLEDFADLSEKSVTAVNEAFESPNKDIPQSVLDYVKDSAGINNALRTAKKTGNKSVLARHLDQIEEMDESLNAKTIKESVQLNRGVVFNDKKKLNAFLEPLSVGAMYEDGAYTSTTVGEIAPHLLIAPFGASIESGNFPIKIKILADKGTRGIYLSKYKKFPEAFAGEQEFLLPKDTKLQVMSRKKKKEFEENFEEIVMRVVNE